MKKAFLTLLTFVVVGCLTMATAQIKTPSASPGAKITQTVGLTDITAIPMSALNGDNITVNTIAPGFIATEMTQGMPEKVLAAAYDLDHSAMAGGTVMVKNTIIAGRKED